MMRFSWMHSLVILLYLGFNALLVDFFVKLLAEGPIFVIPAIGLVFIDYLILTKLLAMDLAVRALLTDRERVEHRNTRTNGQ